MRTSRCSPRQRQCHRECRSDVGINKELPYFISIYGTNGTLHIGWRESKYKVNSSPDWTVLAKAMTRSRPSRARSRILPTLFAAKRSCYIKPADAFASVQVIEAAYKSMSQNLWQPVVEKALAAK